ncbi:MAG TPA: hypothetical protein VF628_02380 [Allosphingosinicella sp.]|jgi:hypothetical protein
MEAGIVQALIGSGPLGLLILYLLNERKADKSDRKEAEQKRLDYDERRLAADLKMTSAIVALTFRITGQGAEEMIGQSR